MKFKKILLFVLIFKIAYASEAGKPSYVQKFFAHKYARWIIGGLGLSFIIGLWHKYQQNKKIEYQKKILDEALIFQKQQESILEESLNILEENEIQEKKEYEKKQKTLATQLIMTPVFSAMYTYRKQRQHLLTPQFFEYVNNPPSENIKVRREKQKKLEQKKRIFSRETLKSIQEKISQQKRDPRPYVLSGSFESSKENKFTPAQIDFLQKFYERHQHVLINALLYRRIKPDDWHQKIKPEIDLFERYFWGEIYSKKHTINLVVNKKNIIFEGKILEFARNILKSININPTSVFFKKVSEKKQKEYEAKGHTLHGQAFTRQESDVISFESTLQQYYLGKLNIINIYYPIIDLYFIGSYASVQESEFFDILPTSKQSTLLHEIGHAYLLHGIERNIINDARLSLTKLQEIEADCILPIFNKRYAEIIFENKMERLINEFFFTYSVKFDQGESKLEDKLTHIFSDDRPSYFEQFIHIADICTQIWNIDVGWEVGKIIQKLFNIQMGTLKSLQYKKTLDDNIFYIDTKSPHYIGAVDPNFEFKVPRLGNNPYKFIKE